jgi:hypothetical protein
VPLGFDFDPAVHRLLQTEQAQYHTVHGVLDAEGAGISVSEIETVTWLP